MKKLSIAITWYCCDRSLGVTCVIFLASFGLYLFGLCPSIYGGDSGELVTSSVILGIPHAPGYPLYVLFGKAASIAIPWANPAYRINILSSIFIAGANCLAFSLFKRITNSVCAAFIGLLTIAFTPVVLDQAHAAEVFGLNLFLAILILHAAINAHPSTPNSQLSTHNAQRLTYLLSFLLGLGLGNHHTLVLILPALIILEVQKYTGHRVQNNYQKYLTLCLCAFVPLCLFFLLGLSVYLYLPLRSYIHPDINFGDPHTWHRFIAVMTRRVFGTFQLHPSALPSREWHVTVVQAWKFVSGYYNQIGFTGIVLTMAGAVYVFWREKKGLAWLILLMVSGPVFYVYANLSPYNALASWRLERFLVLPMIGTGALAAYGCLWLKNRNRYFFAAVFFFLFFGTAKQVSAGILRNNFYFYEFGLDVLREMQPGSLLVIDRVLFDEPTSSVAYSKLVQQRRPDIQVIYRPGTMFGLFYGEDFLELTNRERQRRQTHSESGISKSTTPVYAMTFEKRNLPQDNFKLCGLLYTNNKSSVEICPEFMSRNYLWDNYPPARRLDYITRLLLVHYSYNLAKMRLEQNDEVGANSYFNSSINLGYDMEWLASNIGALWSQKGEALLAERMFKKALSLDLFFPQVHFGLGYAAFMREDFTSAINEYSKAAELSPDYADAYYMWGLSLYRAGRTLEAKAPWSKYKDLAPDSSLQNF